jgi:hypothetical protein
MAMHTQNKLTTGQVSLWLKPATAIRSALRGQRFLGMCFLLSRYENSRSWVEFRDFGFAYRL